MKTRYLLLAVFSFFSLGNAFSQRVGIGTDNPNASAVLDIQSSNKGLLIPRLTTSQRTALSATAATGLLVFDSSLNNFFYYNGSQWIELISGTRDDADADPGNELQVLSLNGNMLTLTNGNTIDLSGLSISDSDWLASGLDIYRNNNAGVGIGTTNPEAFLHVNGSNTSTEGGVKSIINYSGNSDVVSVEGNSVTNPGWGIGGNFTGGYQGVRATAYATTYGNSAYAVSATASGSAGARYGVYGSATGTGTTNYGMYGTATNTATTKYGIYGTASGAGTNNYGIFGTASGATNNYAGYFQGRGYFSERLGIGTTSPGVYLHVAGGNENIGGIKSEINYTGNSDLIASEGSSVTNPGWGIGGKFTGGYRGVTGHADAGNSTFGSAGVYGSAGGTAGTRYGVYGIADGTGTTNYGMYGSATSTATTKYGIYGTATGSGTDNYGIYGSASGATNNWAGYFDGRGYFGDNVGIGTTTPLSTLHVVGEPTIGRIIISPDESSSEDDSEIFLTEDKNATYGMKLFYDGGDNEFQIYGNASGTSYGPHLTVSRNSGVSYFKASNSYSYAMTVENTSSTSADGIMIKVNESQADGSNDFIGFYDNSGMRGKVEGAIAGNVLGAGFGSWVNTTFLSTGSGSSGTIDLLNLNFDFTGAENTTGQSSFNSTNSNFYNSVITNFPGVDLNIEFLVNTIVLSLEVVNTAIQAISGLASVLDPEDIFGTAVDLVSAVANLGIYIGFTASNFGVAYETGSGDYAEWLEKANLEEDFLKGEIVGVIGGKISKRFDEADHYMVVSFAPAVIGNMPPEGEEYRFEKIAFMGQVPVKVMGEVKIGDFILPSGKLDGTGIAVDPDNMKPKDFRRIIGVAWDESDGTEIFKMINTAVGISHNNLANIIDQMQGVMNQMQLAIQDLNPSFQVHLYDVENSPQPNQVQPEYSVASTHSSQTSGLFEGKTYANQAEMIADVKNALTEHVGIDLEKYPLVNTILENPDKSEALLVEFGAKLETLQKLAEYYQGK